jgi:hypothetical protein
MSFERTNGSEGDLFYLTFLHKTAILTVMKKDNLLSGFKQKADALVPCIQCGTREGEPCIPVGKKDVLVWKPGMVHFGRRIKRLLLTAQDPELREQFEAEGLKLLRIYLLEMKK